MTIPATLGQWTLLDTPTNKDMSACTDGSPARGIKFGSTNDCLSNQMEGSGRLTTLKGAKCSCCKGLRSFFDSHLSADMGRGSGIVEERRGETMFCRLGRWRLDARPRRRLVARKINRWRSRGDRLRHNHTSQKQFHRLQLRPRISHKYNLN